MTCVSNVVLQIKSCWQSSVKGVHCQQVTASQFCTTMWQCCTPDKCLWLTLRSPGVDATINTSWQGMLTANAFATLRAQGLQLEYSKETLELAL